VGKRLRELLLTFVTGVASPDSVRLYRAIVAEADGCRAWGACSGRLGRVRSELQSYSYGRRARYATAPIVGEPARPARARRRVPGTGPGTGSPKPEVFERQIDAALALLSGVSPGRR